MPHGPPSPPPQSRSAGQPVSILPAGLSTHRSPHRAAQRRTPGSCAAALPHAAPRTGPDAAVITLTAASGAVATIINSRHWASGYGQRLEAFGPRGVLEAVNHMATSVRYSGASQTSANGP